MIALGIVLIGVLTLIVYGATRKMPGYGDED